MDVQLTALAGDPPVVTRTSPAAGIGPGLLWGLAIAVLVWCARAGLGGAPQLGALIGHVVLLGAPLGLALGLTARRRRPAGSPRLDLPRALVTGGAAGLFGGLMFGWWMQHEGFYPLLAGLLRCESRLVGIAVHYALAVAVGVSFALLFQRDLHGPGSSTAWGMAYAMLWWMVGPFSLMPLLQGRPVDWSAAAARDLHGALIAHLWYGLIVGLTYALADGAWHLLFVGSDPIRREPGSALGRALLAARHGLLAGLVLGAPAALAVRALQPAGLPWSAAAVLVASALSGAAYGVLFRHESPDAGSAALWGAVHGFAAWLVVPMTLVPLLAGDGCRWSAAAGDALRPLLPAFLAHGALVGVATYRLAARHRDARSLDPRVAAAESRRRRPPGTAAAAVWVLVLGLAPLLLWLI